MDALLLHTRWLLLNADEPEYNRNGDRTSKRHHVELVELRGKKAVLATCFSYPLQTWTIDAMAFHVKPSALVYLGKAADLAWIAPGVVAVDGQAGSYYGAWVIRPKQDCVMFDPRPDYAASQPLLRPEPEAGEMLPPVPVVEHPPVPWEAFVRIFKNRDLRHVLEHESRQQECAQIQRDRLRELLELELERLREPAVVPPPVVVPSGPRVSRWDLLGAEDGKGMVWENESCFAGYEVVNQSILYG